MIMLIIKMVAGIEDGLYFKTMCQNYNAQYGGRMTDGRYNNPHCKRCSGDFKIGVEYSNLFCNKALVKNIYYNK